MADAIDDDDESKFAGEGNDFEEWDEELHPTSGGSFRPLFSPPERVVDSLDEALELDRSLSGGHDAKSLAVRSNQGIYGLMCIVNYCRSMQLAGKSGDEIIQAVVNDNQPFCASDDSQPIERWMTPVSDMHDALLQELLDSFDEEFDADDGNDNGGGGGSNDAAVANVTSEELKGYYLQASGLLKPGDDVDPRPVDCEDKNRPEMVDETKKKRDESYFTSYNTIGIHREMLSDKSRMAFYSDAIRSCDLAGKLVLDVGAGTGIMSMLCARQGASRVIAVEAAPETAQLARRIIESNGFDNIDVKSCRVEALDECELQDVDVIVSEWMGYSLLFEAMLESVLWARDRCARPPTMLPSTATLFCALGSEEAVHNASFWRDVEGFDFSFAGEMERESCERSAPLVRVVPPSSIISDSATLRSWNLETMSSRDQSFTRDVEFTIDSNAAQAQGGTHVSCIVLWFDVGFPASNGSVLDTSPSMPPTHWAQTVLPLSGNQVPVHDGQTVMLRLNLAKGLPEDDHRGLVFAVQVASSKEKLDDAPVISYSMS